MSAGVCVERQTGETCGKSIFHPLAGDLQSEFPGISGFSVSSLRGMKNLYEAYRSSEKLAPLVREIGWRHNSVILKREFVQHTVAQISWCNYSGMLDNLKDTDNFNVETLGFGAKSRTQIGVVGV